MSSLGKEVEKPSKKEWARSGCFLGETKTKLTLKGEKASHSGGLEKGGGKNTKRGNRKPGGDFITGESRVPP